MGRLSFADLPDVPLEEGKLGKKVGSADAAAVETNRVQECLPRFQHDGNRRSSCAMSRNPEINDIPGNFFPVPFLFDSWSVAVKGEGWRLYP